MSDRVPYKYLIPTCFALLVLSLTLGAIRERGWRHTEELAGDVYVGYSASLLIDGEYKPCPDSGWIMCEGRDGRRQLTAYRLPGYPFALSGLMLLYGTEDPLAALRLTQALFSAMLVFLSIGAAYKLQGPLAAFITGLSFLLLAQPIGQYALMLKTELVFALLLMILVHVMIWRRRALVATGALLAVLCLTRGVLLFALPLLVLTYRPRQWVRLGAGFALVLLPWVIRNWLVFGAFIPFSTIGGGVLYCANNPHMWAEAGGSCLNIATYPIGEQAASLTELDADRFLRAEAIDFVLSQPLTSVTQNVLAKWRFLLSVRSLPRLPLVVGVVGTGLMITAAAVRGGGRHRTLARYALIVGILWLGLLINTAIFWGGIRFRFPLEAPTLVLIGVAGSICWSTSTEAIRSHRSGR